MKTCHIANRAGSALASARPSALRSIAGLALTLSIVPGTALAQEKGAQPARTAEAVLPTQIQTALHIVQQDLAIAELLQALRGPAPRGLLAVRDVRVIDPITETVSANQSVIVDGDRIAWTGDLAKEPKEARDAKSIDGRGLYLSPGLTDMHVHSSSASSWLLDLSNGVTGVREMAGFPWMLRAREKINAGAMLAPTLVVAGPLMNAFPLEGYAVVVRSPLDARRSVRQQAACGYDFIKVHNIVPEPIFDAIAEQARAEGMDLVGHVPHGIPVPHAIQLGMRTMEHLKGFIDDQTLTQGDTNYSSASADNVWNTPTLYVGRASARGEEAESYLAGTEMQYVPLRRREGWKQLLVEPDSPRDWRETLGCWQARSFANSTRLMHTSLPEPTATITPLKSQASRSSRSYTGCG